MQETLVPDPNKADGKPVLVVTPFTEEFLSTVTDQASAQAFIGGGEGASLWSSDGTTLIPSPHVTRVNVHNDTSAFEPDTSQFWVRSTDGTQLYQGILEASVDGVGSKLDLSANDGAGATSAVLVKSIPSDAFITLGINGTERVRVQPAAADGSPIFSVDSSIAHTGGSFVEFKNNGVDVLLLRFDDPDFSQLRLISGDEVDLKYLNFEASPDDGGRITIYSGDSDNSKLTFLSPGTADGQVPYRFGTSVEHTSGNLVEITNNGDLLFFISKNSANLKHDDGAGTISSAFQFVDGTISRMGAQWNSPTDDQSLVLLSAQERDARLRIDINDQTYVRLIPANADGSTPFFFDTSIAHTSGPLLEFANLGTNYLETIVSDAGATYTTTFWSPAQTVTNSVMIIVADNWVGAATLSAVLVGASSPFDNTGVKIFSTSFGGSGVIGSDNGAQSFALSDAGLNVNHGTLQTGDPGNGIGTWKLGKKLAATVLTPTTNYYEVMVDGVVGAIPIVSVTP